MIETCLNNTIMTSKPFYNNVFWMNSSEIRPWTCINLINPTVSCLIHECLRPLNDQNYYFIFQALQSINISLPLILSVTSHSQALWRKCVLMWISLSLLHRERWKWGGIRCSASASWRGARNLWWFAQLLQVSQFFCTYSYNWVISCNLSVTLS